MVWPPTELSMSSSGTSVRAHHPRTRSSPHRWPRSGPGFRRQEAPENLAFHPLEDVSNRCGKSGLTSSQDNRFAQRPGTELMVRWGFPLPRDGSHRSSAWAVTGRREIRKQRANPQGEMDVVGSRLNLCRAHQLKNCLAIWACTPPPAGCGGAHHLHLNQRLEKIHPIVTGTFNCICGRPPRTVGGTHQRRRTGPIHLKSLAADRPLVSCECCGDATRQGIARPRVRR